MSLTNVSVDDFTKALASKTSVPGGGGAAALVGAIAIALGDMVGEFTVGKKKYADVEEDIKELMKRSLELRESLIACIDKDAEAFEPLSKAYSIPKDDPARDEIMEQCLKDAAKVPFEILTLSCEAVELLSDFAKKGSVMMISDAATGATMARAAIEGAAVNVKINTKSMKDQDAAQKINSEVDNMLKKYVPMAQEVFESVYRGY